jgi:hypothetical protein
VAGILQQPFNGLLYVAHQQRPFKPRVQSHTVVCFLREGVAIVLVLVLLLVICTAFAFIHWPPALERAESSKKGRSFEIFEMPSISLKLRAPYLYICVHNNAPTPIVLDIDSVEIRTRGSWPGDWVAWSAPRLVLHLDPRASTCARVLMDYWNTKHLLIPSRRTLKPGTYLVVIEGGLAWILQSPELGPIWAGIGLRTRLPLVQLPYLRSRACLTLELCSPGFKPGFRGGLFR